MPALRRCAMQATMYGSGHRLEGSLKTEHEIKKRPSQWDGLFAIQHMISLILDRRSNASFRVASVLAKCRRTMLSTFSLKKEEPGTQATPTFRGANYDTALRQYAHVIHNINAAAFLLQTQKDIKHLLGKCVIFFTRHGSTAKYRISISMIDIAYQKVSGPSIEKAHNSIFHELYAFALRRRRSGPQHSAYRPQQRR